MMTHVASAAARTERPNREYDVRSPDGTTLRAREWGAAGGAGILFVHGWSQCDLCWGRQLASTLADACRLVTFDHRGHGSSGRPAEPDAYADGRRWADDLDAVIRAAGLDRPVVVAWSYGGFVLGDYLRVHGDRAIGGIVLAGAAVVLRPPRFDHIGAAFVESAIPASDPDPRVSIPAVRAFLAASTERPLDAEAAETALAWTMLTPPEVRGALLAREIDVTDAFAAAEVPILVVHGRRDRIVSPSMAEHVLAACPTAIASWYEDVGHLPFLEAPERFDRELAAFAEHVA